MDTKHPGFAEVCKSSVIRFIADEVVRYYSLCLLAISNLLASLLKKVTMFNKDLMPCYI